MIFLGEAIALATVLCWTMSVQCFETASKRVGVSAVNTIRIFVALIFFGVLLLYRDGSPIPLHFPTYALWMLGLSGVVGFFLGDLFLFKALVELGPRVAMLIQGLAAPAAAFIGWLCLDETYLLSQWLGIGIAVSGVGLVVLEKTDKKQHVNGRQARTITLKGIGFGIFAMLGQAVGYILSKAGMQTETGYLDAFAATEIRALAAFACFLVFLTVTRRWRSVQKAIADRKALAFTSIGAFLGPFLGVSLSLLSLHYLDTGIAATFLSLVPVCIIPFSIVIHKEHVSFRAVIGAFVAVYGVYLLVS